MTGEERKTSSERLEAVFLTRIESSINKREPLRLAKEDPLVLKEALEDAGVNFNISVRQRAKLFERPGFRARVKVDEANKVEGVEIYDDDQPKHERWIPINNFNFQRLRARDDRTNAVLIMLGKRKFEELITRCYEKAKRVDYPGLVGEYEGTRGRGFQQAMADLLALALLDTQAETFDSELREIEARLNRKLLVSFLNTEPEQAGQIRKRFETVEAGEPGEHIRGFPPDQFTSMIRFLAEK